MVEFCPSHKFGGDITFFVLNVIVFPLLNFSKKRDCIFLK